MYKENCWIHVKTNVITGVNKPPGSPRMWVNRALDLASTEIGQGVVRPKNISVAAVWLRPCNTIELPYTSLVRFFKYTPNARKYSRNKPESYKAIGIAWEVPFEQIFPVMKLLKESGAEMVWWYRPIPEKEKPKTLAELGVCTRLDHAEIYKLFDQGKTVLEVSRIFDAQPNTVRYVYKKWKLKKPPEHMHFGRKPLNRDSVLEDLRLNELTMQQIADKHGCTRHTVHKIAKSNNIFRL